MMMKTKRTAGLARLFSLPLTPYSSVHSGMYGINAMTRARLIAVFNFRWCIAHTPLRRRGAIFLYDDTNLPRSWTSL